MSELRYITDADIQAFGFQPEQKGQPFVIHEEKPLALPVYRKARFVEVNHHDSPQDELEGRFHVATWHRRYVLGTEQPAHLPNDFILNKIKEVSTKDYRACERKIIQQNTIGDGEAGKAVQQFIHDTFSKHYYHEPLFMYDHSGISISTSPFSCQWDSGRIGMIYERKADAAHRYDHKRANPALHKKWTKEVNSYIEYYDAQLRNDIWEIVLAQYVRTPDGEEIKIEDYCDYYGQYIGLPVNLDEILDELKAEYGFDVVALDPPY